MTNDRSQASQSQGRKVLNKVFFVAFAVLLSVALVYIISLRSPVTYRASLNFQIASSPQAPKPNLRAEKQLLLSDALLTQVLDDSNLLPKASKGSFRSFDLGPDYKAENGKPHQELLKRFRHDLKLSENKDEGVIGIHYKSSDANEARQIVETIFEKFRDWRKSGLNTVFDREMVEADKNLAARREAFLSSQKAFLEFVETQAASPKSGQVPQLTIQKAELASKIAALQLRYGPKHPVLQEALRQQEALNAGSIKPDIGETSMVQTRLASLREKMQRDFSDLDVAIRQAVAVEQKKIKGLPSFEILPLGDVTVVSSEKSLPAEMMFSGITAFLISLLYLKFRVHLRPTFETARQIETAFKFPCIGRIPGLLKSREGEIALPAGATAETLKSLRQELKLRAGDAPIKLVTLTSSLPPEGRTELAAGLGRLAARSGEKVLILDADLRSPSFQSRLRDESSGSKPPRNIVDYLSGQSRIEDIILRNDVSGVHVIYGTAIPNTALDLLSSDKMKTLLLSLREVYDLVLVQAPVALRGPDARVLASLSDQTIYVVESNKTLKSEIEMGLAPFIESGIRNLSFVLSEN